ncbi:glycoside hydrolase family 16 protein [Microbacterium sp. M28]|uniref:glycoside hydrolase family 16 protein n=1 Tax=Microbacterium sp. M28 TaxID=2962064 RepID=UPI0021F480D6|nr:glycoside hydrolase family 16 protein [Microbacterium sp. M28]UYO96660.1 glycoside hydrolase family 16 protein [Microbacterium sp. M28]
MKNTTAPTRSTARILVAVFAALAALAVLAATLVASPPAQAATAPMSTVASVIPRQSIWTYHHAAAAPPSNWKTVAPSWPTGRAPFGKGVRLGPVGTMIPAPSTSPLSAYFRKSFTLTSDLPEWMWLNTWADDGIVVWVNGVEVGRKNAPAGQVGQNSYATQAPSTDSAKSSPVTFTIPSSVLREGGNTIAVQVLFNWRRTPNVSFDAHLVRKDTITTTPPVTPVPEVPEVPEGPEVKPPSGGDVAGWGAPTWRDEFSHVDPSTGAPAVDATKWNVRGRDDLGLLFDAAVVERDQVSTDDSGILHIRADWLPQAEKRPAAQSGPTDLWHTTGYLDQRRLQTGDVAMSQRYGRWEIRAKTPTGENSRGSLAAFWLRNSQSGEIDIMEAWGRGGTMPAEYDTWLRDTAATTVHTKTDGTGRKSVWRHREQGAATVPWDGFHVYAFELTPTYAATFVDGVEVMRVTPATYPDLWDPNYFGTPLHMRLNLHVGPSATYWGLPDPARRSLTQDLDFQVDYVRVWSYDGN